jgi:hypothetical protein
MKIDNKTIFILVLIALVVVLILFKDCGRINNSSKGIDIELIYDSIERVIASELPPSDTIEVEKEVVKWLPSAKVYDTIYIDGQTKYVYNDAPIDTAAILTHYLTQAVTYVDTIEDSSLQAVILDTIFRNKITARTFNYKWKQPIEIRKIDNRDRFQLIASFQAGGGMSYANTPNALHAGLDIGLKFKNGTYFSLGYMAGTSHYATLRVGQVIRLKKR